MNPPNKPELTLDPQDWSRLRDLGHRMLDDVFRYLVAANQGILADLQESGVAVLPSTVLQGKFALCVAICNHRRRFPDVDRLVEEVLRLGRNRVAEAQPVSATG